MKKILILLVGIATLFSTGCCRKDDASKAQSYVEVMGTAEKEIDPDIFYLSVTLSENSTAKSQTISVLEQKFLTALKSLNIDTQKDLTVTSLSGDNYSWWRKSRAVYQNKSYQLKLNDLTLVSKVCDKLDSIGCNNFYLNRVDYSKMEDLKKEAQQDAVKQARTKAENILSGEGQHVDELVYVQEQGIGNVSVSRIYDSYNKLVYDAEYESTAENLNFQKIKIEFSVIARFSIK
jgi:uncharacterized protein YggE